MPKFSRTRHVRTSALVAASALALSSCSSPTPTRSPAPVDSGYPTGHLHGMTVDTATKRVLLATHDGLFDVSAQPASRIGPVIDLMGFTATDDGEFYASGHPGMGTDLPDPVGLIRSEDRGKTWELLSRQGESDFHALTKTRDGIVGFDGQVTTSADGQEWNPSDFSLQPFSLAASTTSNAVLATTEEGLQRSTDAGRTWNALPQAPLLLLTDLDGANVAGVTPNGQVHISADAGTTWEPGGRVEGEPAAITIHTKDDGTLDVWVATATGVEVSNDGGHNFSALIPAAIGQ